MFVYVCLCVFVYVCVCMCVYVCVCICVCVFEDVFGGRFIEACVSLINVQLRIVMLEFSYLDVAYILGWITCFYIFFLATPFLF